MGEDCEGACYTEGAGYLVTCKICTKEQELRGIQPEDIVHNVYLGETHRSIHFRSQCNFEEYRAALRKKGEEEEEEEQEGEEEKEYPAGFGIMLRTSTWEKEARSPSKTLTFTSLARSTSPFTDK